MLVWAYAIAIMNKDEPENIYGAKLGSPMILWVSNDWIVLSSDINTVSKYAHEFISLDDREIVKITWNTYQVFSLKQGEYIDKEREKVDDDFSVAHKWNFETFTEKEIHEIPEVLANVCKGRIDFETWSIRSETLESLAEKDYEKIEIIASWSSYFAGLVGCAWFKSLAGIDAEVRVSSEFLYDIFIPQENVLYVFMSQSWETADVRESVRKVQEKWCHTFGIVNTVWSTIARMCDSGMYTHAWIEVGVASTKNVIAQLAVLLMMAVSIWSKKGLQSVEAKTILKELWSLKDTIKEQLVDQDELKKLVESYSHYQNFFFLWRWLLLGTAEEASLKLKELSYLHSEAYATGELKHGPLALVWEDFPCFVMWATQTIYEKTISNVKEISARKAPVVGVVFENSKYQEVYDDVIKIPLTHEQLAPFTTLIPMWLFAVEVAKKLRKDIDKPQNLAKSVTVE
jgi:glucosamine--fructose-6-phosphate aminotransferase (isomerizing)